MTHVDTTRMKGMLEGELLRLERELATVGRKNPDNPGDWEASAAASDLDILQSDENEVADQIEQYEENVAILGDLEPQLNDVKRALEKIENGTYGLCETCNEPIESERLEANPSARTCVKHMG
jgi:RNA polymerase-binding transcription factor DksA